MKTFLGVLAMVAFIATIYVANYLVTEYGVVDVGFGLMAPAAVFAAGFAFTFRDLVHSTLGRFAVVAAIVIGALVSLGVSERFALASAVAFLVSEMVDFAIFTRVADRSWLGAVAASNIGGLVIDSVLFLAIAFGSMQFLAGQIVGKAWTTLAAIGVLALGRAAARAVLPRHA